MEDEHRQVPTAGPRIADVKVNALDDGPGIRSTVFFKGCPLDCVWCQNPESLSPHRELQVSAERCIACARCIDVCPEGSARTVSNAQDRTHCRVCGTCVESCPSGARRVVGDDADLDDLVKCLVRDAPFYRRSGGGVTLSGGEPTLYMEFAGSLAEALSARGIPVLLETCGHFSWEAFERMLLPYLHTIYYDVKLEDPRTHRRYTGRDNHRILDNLQRIAGIPGPDVLPRIPLVPGITDTDGNLTGLASLLKKMGFTRVALLPYNPLWLSKRRALGLAPAYTRTDWMDDAELARCREPFQARGLEISP